MRGLADRAPGSDDERLRDRLRIVTRGAIGFRLAAGLEPHLGIIFDGVADAARELAVCHRGEDPGEEWARRLTAEVLGPEWERLGDPDHRAILRAEAELLRAWASGEPGPN